MKTIKEWEKEINKIVTEKVETTVKKFKDERAKDLIELAALSQKLEDLEKKTAPFLEEKGSLNILKNADLARSNYLDIHLPYLEKQVKGIQDQIEKITQKLTEVEIDPKTLSFFLNFKS